MEGQGREGEKMELGAKKHTFQTSSHFVPRAPETKSKLD